MSTDKQANEGYSLEAQRDKLGATAGHRTVGRWTLRTCTLTPASVASLPNAPTIRHAGRVAAGDVRRIVAIKLDRLSRNTRDFLGLLDYCDEHGCGIVSIAESFDTTTPVGRAVVTVLMAFAELERKQIGERMQMGTRRKSTPR